MRNLTFKAAMLKGSQPTVNRQSTDGQSQRHCKQTPLSKRWKVLMTLVFLFTFTIGNMWGADVTFGYGTSMSTTSGATGTKDSLATITHLTLTKEVGKSGVNKLSDTLSVYSNGNQACFGVSDGNNKPTAQYSKGAYKWNKSRNSFSPNLYVGYKVEIEDGYKLNLSGLTSLMYVSSDFTYKVCILDKNQNELFSTESLTISNYNSKTSVNAQIDSLLSDNANLQNLKDSIFVRAYMYKGSTGKYFFISKLQLTGAVESAGGGGGGDEPGGDPVNPVFTYTPATYTIGDPALDLSTKLTSTNTTGAITFAVSTADAGTTGASIANGKNFTATTAGTAKVTVSQVASTGYNAKSQDIDVTVVAPDPCTTHHWFVATADATSNGVTNWNGFTNGVTGSTGQTNSVTIDGTTYSLTKRTGSTTGTDGIILGFTIPANKAGTLYGYMKSSGTGARTLSLKKGDDVVKTNTEITDGSWTLITIDAIAPGTYTLSPDQNVQVQMFVLKICDAEFNTITLEYADGVTPDGSIDVIDGTAATKPADPTWAHHRFDGWYNGQTAYDWSANVTGDLTLTAHWTQLYTVTYAKGDESATGDAPTQEDLAAGEKFTVAANTFAVAGKDFDTWNDGTNDYAPDAEYTMGSANVVLTAQWKTASAKYTVIFKDGDTELGTKLFEVGSVPSDAEIDKTKPMFTFAAWQKDEADIALDAAFWATVAKDATVTLTARWEKLYASTIDIEEFIDDNGTSGDWATYLSNHGYAISSTSDVSLDGGDGGNKPADKGLKIKKTGRTITFEVVANKLVTLKVGSLKNDGASISVNGGEYTALESANPLSTGASVYTYYHSNAVANYSIKTNGDDYCIIQSITIEDPYVVTFNANGGEEVTAMEFHGTALTLPSATKGTEVFKGWYDAAEDGNLIGKAGESYTPTADITLYAQWETVSTDNTLSALEVDGVALADFDPDKHIYNIVCEYGHTPQITLATATANAQGATVAISNTPVHYVDENNDFWYVQANVTPASGTPIGYNQVRYTIKPKLGVCLVKGNITNDAIARDASSYLKTEDVTLENNGVSGHDSGASGSKFQKGKYIKLSMEGGATFKAGDVLALNVTKVANDTIRVFNSEENIPANVIARGTALMEVGMNYVVLTEDAAVLVLKRGDDNEYQVNWNPHVTDVSVLRCMPSFIESFELAGVVGTVDQDLKTIAVEVPYSTDITSLTPTIKAWANKQATVTPTTAQDFSSAVTYKVKSAYEEDGEVVYTVTVTKAEASHDATLSDIKLDGVSLKGFDPATLSYNVELEKGTLAYPTVTYTAATGATVVPNSETFPGAYNLVVTAEDGLEENKKTYTINFTVSTKDKVVIFDGSEASPAIHEAPTTIDGLSWTVTGLSVGTNKAIAPYTKTIATGGSTGTSKNIAVTIPSKYNVQFELVQVTNSSGDARYAYIGEANNTSFANALFTLGSTDQTKNEKGISEALAGGKTYYIHSSNSINFSEIVLYLDRVSEAPAISAQPAALAVCDAATNTNALSVTASVEAGTLSYQWYKVVEEGDDVAVGTNSNEFVPTAVGEYYVVVTNVEGEYAPSSKKSDEATVSLKAQTEITGFENAAAPLNTEKTLSVTAAGTGTLTYKWQACTEAGVVTDENVLSSATTYGVTITEEPQYYLVTVEGECGSATQVLYAKKWADLELVDVEGSMTWNFAASNTGITDDVAVPSTMVLANAGQGAMPNTDNFHSDMLKAIVGSTETKVRKSTDDGCYQGTGIMFHTTVPGIVTVTYRGTGNNADVTLTVGSKTFDTYHGGFTTCDKVFVPAGDVAISSVGTMRIQKIVFNAEPDYPRPVTEGRYGTICLPNGGVMTGATLYEIAYYEASSMKIFFDEIINGTMEAGMPYIFLPNENATQLGVFYTDAANADAKTDPAETNGLIGSYVEADVPVGNYILSNNQYWYVDVLGTAKVTPNRAYIRIQDVPDYPTAPAPGRRRVSMNVNAPQVATGIDALNAGEAPVKVLINGQIFILRGEKMYDATGRLVK